MPAPNLDDIFRGVDINAKGLSKNDFDNYLFDNTSSLFKNGAPFTPSKVGSRRAFSDGGTVGAGNVSYKHIIAAESDFDAVRIVYYNPSSAPLTVGAIGGSTTASIGDGYNAVDSGGAYLTPKAIKTNDFSNNVPLLNLGPSLGGTNTTLIIPAAEAYPGTSIPDNIPGKAWTDWTPFKSIPRVDDPNGLPLFVWGDWSASGTGLPNIGQSGGLNYDSIDQKRIFRTYIRSGANYTLLPGVTGFVQNSQSIRNCVVQFLYRNAGVTGLFQGNSLTKGALTTGNANSFGHQLCCEISTRLKPVTHQNWGVQGQDSLSLFANGRKHILESSPQFVVFPAYTPNDGHTQASADNSLAQALMCAQYALSKGCVPIITTPIPGGTSDALEDSYRLSVRTGVINSGYYYADAESLGTGENPNKIKPEWSDPDGIHLNDAGHAAWKDIVKVPVLQVMSKYFGM